MLLSLRRRLGDERGATLILVVLFMVLLLVSAGMVVNIGLVRADRSRNKSVADVAVTAGMQAFDAGNGRIAPFRGACEALDYLMANHPELSSLSLSATWTTGTGGAISGSGNPCQSTPTASTAYTNNHNRVCDTSTLTNARNSFAWFTGTTGSVDVVVKAGYAASDMTFDAFADDSYHTDTGAAGYHGCDQLAVIVTERESAGFGKVAGAGELSSRIRTVGRVTVKDKSEAAVALLLIEPAQCDALKIGGAGSGVRVKGTLTNPGIIHADSTGTSGCGGSAKVLVGHHDGGIIAEQAPVSPFAAGIVSVTAPLTTTAHDGVTRVVAQGGAPENNDPKGRSPVDERFLGLDSSYGMTDLRADALSVLGWSDATALAANYDVVSGGGCNFGGGTYTPPAGKTKVFLRCADLDKNVAFASTVTDVVLTGKVSLNGKTVTMPNVRNLIIGGATGSNGRGIDLNSGGTLSVNRKGFASCALREAADPANYSAGRMETTRVVVKSGQVEVGASSALQICSTTLYLMGVDGSGTGTLPTSWGTTPADNSDNGNINVASTGFTDWTAPNRTSTTPTAADLENFEDLAFWTETSEGNAIGGSNATMTLKGIFFTPNANSFDINAGGAGITADAQFITRKLNVQGGGQLTLTADPYNSIPIKFFSDFSLVR